MHYSPRNGGARVLSGTVTKMLHFKPTFKTAHSLLNDIDTVTVSDTNTE